MPSFFVAVLYAKCKQSSTWLLWTTGFKAVIDLTLLVLQQKMQCKYWCRLSRLVFCCIFAWIEWLWIVHVITSDNGADTDTPCIGLLRWLLSTWSSWPLTSIHVQGVTEMILQIISTIYHAASRQPRSVPSITNWIYLFCIVAQSLSVLMSVMIELDIY